MVREEALLILGFGETETPEPKEVVKAHRGLMMRFHGDITGGSSAVVSQKINEARDTLVPPKSSS